jgi:hypothetical protein
MILLCEDGWLAGLNTGRKCPVRTPKSSRSKENLPSQDPSVVVMSIWEKIKVTSGHLAILSFPVYIRLRPTWLVSSVPHSLVF